MAIVAIFEERKIRREKKEPYFADRLIHRVFGNLARPSRRAFLSFLLAGLQQQLPQPLLSRVAMIAFVPGHTFGKTGGSPAAEQRFSCRWPFFASLRGTTAIISLTASTSGNTRKTADRQSYSPGPTKRRQCVVGYAAKAIALP